MAIISFTATSRSFFYFYFTGTYNRTKFYERSINEKVIGSSDWQKRTIEYYLENGLSINIAVLDRIDLKIGDSIVKESETNQFKVYRKESNGMESISFINGIL